MRLFIFFSLYLCHFCMLSNKFEEIYLKRVLGYSKHSENGFFSADVDLVVHAAGPFQQSQKCTVLEAAIETQVRQR